MGTGKDETELNVLNIEEELLVEEARRLREASNLLVPSFDGEAAGKR